MVRLQHRLWLKHLALNEPPRIPETWSLLCKKRRKKRFRFTNMKNRKPLTANRMAEKMKNIAVFMISLKKKTFENHKRIFNWSTRMIMIAIAWFVTAFIGETKWLQKFPNMKYIYALSGRWWNTNKNGISEREEREKDRDLEHCTMHRCVLIWISSLLLLRSELW